MKTGTLTEKEKASLRKYYHTHKDKCKAQHARWRKENRESYNAWCRAYYAQNKEKRQAQSRASCQRWRQQIREEVLTYYGNGKLACVVCGFTNLKALGIDHIAGGGNAHRRLLGGYLLGVRFYGWLKRQDYPTGYQTLCMNCQYLKR